MRSIRHRPWTAATLAVSALLVLSLGAPSAASAAKLVSAKAVINSCSGSQLAMTARAKPRKRVSGRRAKRRLRRFKRKIRGAKLEVQFRAIALFGGERRSAWIRADRGGRASESFAGLPADTWTGFVRFRWRKRGRTRGSSFVTCGWAKQGRCGQGPAAIAVFESNGCGRKGSGCRSGDRFQVLQATVGPCTGDRGAELLALVGGGVRWRVATLLDFGPQRLCGN